MTCGYSQFYLQTIFLLVCRVGGDVEEAISHPGHLQPIGSHSKTVEVESTVHFPSPAVFFREYVNVSKPLVIRGGAKISPAYVRWTDEYFLSIPAGNSYNVVVEQAKKENRSLSPEEISFTDFVKRYKNDDIYLVNSVPDFIGQDVYLPPCLLCPDVVDYLLAKLMWFSSGGTKSVLHYDSAENINCLFAGEKMLYLIDPNKYSDKVPIENKKSAYSNVDVERVDFVRYPSLKDIEYHYVKMAPVNIWWSPSAQPYLPDCNLKNTSLDQLEFLGFTELFTRETIDGVKSLLKSLFKTHDGAVTLEQFRLYATIEADVFEEGAVWSVDMIKKLDQIFHMLDSSSQDSILTPDDVNLVSQETWESIVPIFKELNSLVSEQFEPDGDDDDFGPVDSKAADDKHGGYDRTEL